VTLGTACGAAGVGLALGSAGLTSEVGSLADTPTTYQYFQIVT